MEDIDISVIILAKSIDIGMVIDGEEEEDISLEDIEEEDILELDLLFSDNTLLTDIQDI
jgi:hypothetical protein